MARNKYLILSDDSEAEYETDVDAQVARLREVLALMAPESGSSALGATRKAATGLPRAERVKILANHRA